MATESDREDTGQQEILARIHDLVAVEKSLRESIARDDPEVAEGERARLDALEAVLDQCWDLLRQRRAKTEFGEDPAEAELRPASEVKRYLS